MNQSTGIPCLNPTLMSRSQMRDLVSYARTAAVTHPQGDNLLFAAAKLEQALASDGPLHDRINTMSDQEMINLDASAFLTGTQQQIDAAFAKASDFSWT